MIKSQEVTSKTPEATQKPIASKPLCMDFEENEFHDKDCLEKV